MVWVGCITSLVSHGEGLLEGVRLPGTRSGWRISQSAVERFLARMKQAGERRDE